MEPSNDARGRTELLLITIAVLVAALIGAILVVAANIPKPNSIADWLTIVLAIAAVGQIVVGAIALQSLRHAQTSADAAMRSLATSQDTAHRQLRAYVAVRSFDFEKLTVGDRLLVKIKYANTGQTPAHELSVDSLIGIYGAAIAISFPAEEAAKAERGSVAHVGAQSEIVQTSRMESALTAADLKSLEDGDAKIVCCGRISYRDVFGEPQYTDFHATLSQHNAHGLTEFRRSPTGNFGT